MSRMKRIADGKAEIEKSLKNMNATDPNAYGMGRINFFYLRVIDEKLDDLSERMKLIEAALGLIAESNKRTS